MSNESAFANPASAASFAAPTTPAAGPDSSANAACAAASSSVARPPDERMTSGEGRPAAHTGVGEPAEVAREHRAEVGIDRGRRRALVLPELRRHFVGRDDVSIRVAAAQLARHRLLGGVVSKGEEQRDGDRLGLDSPAACSGRAGRARRPGRFDHGPPRNDPAARAAADARRTADRGARGSADGDAGRARSPRS